MRPQLLLLSVTVLLPLLCSSADAARQTSKLIYTQQKADTGEIAPGQALRLTPSNYPGLFTTWERVTDWERGVNQTVKVGEFYHTHFTDGEPKLIPGPGGSEFVVCMLPKVGSTRWKELLFMQHAPPPTDIEFDVHHAKMSWLPWNITREELVRRVSKPKHLRFLWLRNPYSRLLSGFLDKGVLNPFTSNYDNGMAGYGAPFQPEPAEFLRFVTSLVAMRKDGLPLDIHFRPQVEQCGVMDGMQYDFHLKVEDIHVWYPDLISLFGLEDTVRSGWGHESHPNLPAGTPDCFYPMPQKTCQLTDLIIAHHTEYAENIHGVAGHPLGHAHSDLPGGNAEQAWMASATTSHSHSADTHIQQYYNSQEIVQLATEFLREDLERFDYPEMHWEE